jgi:hypothetical protein
MEVDIIKVCVVIQLHLARTGIRYLFDSLVGYMFS